MNLDVDVAAACFGGGWQIALRLSKSVQLCMLLFHMLSASGIKTDSLVMTFAIHEPEGNNSYDFHF